MPSYVIERARQPRVLDGEGRRVSRVDERSVLALVRLLSEAYAPEVTR